LVAGSLIHVQFNAQSIFKLCYFNLSFNNNLFVSTPATASLSAQSR